MKNKVRKSKLIFKLEKPLSKGYKYFGVDFQEFINKKKDGLTPLNALRYLQHYSETNQVGNSSKSNCKKAIVNIVRLTLMKNKRLEQEIYYREALKIFKIRLPTKTVMKSDIPTSEDLRLAKENSHIKVQLLIDFVSTTSLRIGEIVRIKVSSCRFNDIDNGYSIKFIRKGGNEFETWIPKQLYQRIVIEYGSTNWLFQSPYTDKSHLAIGTAQKWLRDASKFTTRPVRPHLIRHKSINEVISENPGIPLFQLCEAFGHSEATLKKYYLIKDKVDITAINKQHYLKFKKSERTSK
jgi:integrase